MSLRQAPFRKPHAIAATFSIAVLLSACITTGTDPNSPSPTSGSGTSETANAMADKAMYKPVDYANANKKGPPIVVIPGEVKSNNANFTQKFGPNNIADYAELELGKANFKVLERADMARCSTNSSWPTRWATRRRPAKCCRKGNSRPPSGS